MLEKVRHKSPIWALFCQESKNIISDWMGKKVTGTPRASLDR